MEQTDLQITHAIIKQQMRIWINTKGEGEKNGG